MRIPLAQTLSGRILLGFTVLTLTFGTISILIVYYMGMLGNEIRLIRTGYVPLALEAKDLDEKQEILWSYVFSELKTESDDNRVGSRIIKYTDARLRALRQTEEVLDQLVVEPDQHRKQIAATRRQVSEIAEEVAATGRHYYTIRKRPPLDGMAEQLSGDVEARVQYERSRAALETLTRAETELRNKIQTLASQLSNQAETTALILERQERRLRLFTITTGLLAVLIGLLVTLWATMTLRPLQRLRAAARRIARGEYESRISEKGPTEVADLAREFNVMGRAVEERERELVRQERLVAVGKMAAMITHEVRNPLSAIGLNTELLEEELSEFGDTSEGRALCRAITTEVDRLTAITEEYLQFARLPKPKRQPEQVNAIIRSLVEFQREPLAQRGVELTCELDEQLPAVLVDHSQLRQALLNLLRNAAEAVADSGLGTVTLNSRQVRGGDGDAVEIAVGDSGPGVSADILPNLFDPFVSSKEGGTGLGLALTHQIIREHGGDIRVDSAPGQGATFIISLPAPGGGDRMDGIES